MRQFIFLVAFLSLAPTVFAMDVEFGGQHRMRGEFDQQQNQDLQHGFTQRFKFSGAFRPNEMFESHFWLMSNYHWGEAVQVFGEHVRLYGYGDWKVSDEFMIKIGRTPYEIADGSTMGLNDFEKYPYVFDGLFLSYNTESIALDVFGVFLPQGFVNGVETPSNYDNAVGISVDVRSLPEQFRMANLFGIYALRGDSVAQYRVGIGVGGDVAGLDYNLIGVLHGSNDSEDSDVQYVLDAGLGYTMDFDARIYINGHYESDQYDPFYYDYHGRSGLLDKVVWGNGVAYVKGGLSYMPIESFDIGVGVLYFLIKEDIKDKVEADLYLKKTYAGGFGFKIEAGAFDLASDENVYWKARLDASFDF